MINEIIAKQNDSLKDIQIIINEVSKRRVERYYKDYANQLLRMFRAQITDMRNINIVKSYREILKEVINELYDNLQTMKFDTFNSDIILNPKYPSKYHYDFSKVYSRLHNPSYECLYEHHIENIQKLLHKYVVIDRPYDYDQVYLLINAGLYVMRQNKKAN